eukprot:TRINITY_DN80737_c0_g1_i2.p1 TRINITY_DN80737_c0_g1~~TRINITY_DN80737_c0_g1_i2.p1  ORF type:complete len:722 (-),score=192.07 TRINITY_DN80737_c0_g1_i2:605-2770(-)
MHALPQKLADLREEICAQVARQLTEQRLYVEKELKESTSNSEKSAIRHVCELLQPQIDTLSSRHDSDVETLWGKVKANFATCQEETAELTKQVQKQEKDLLARLISVKSELPTISARIKTLEEETYVLRQAPAELKKDLDDTVTKLSGGMERLRSQVSEEAAASRESGLALESKIRQATQVAQDVAEASEKSTLKTAAQASALEERLGSQFGDLQVRCEAAEKASLKEYIQKLVAETFGEVAAMEGTPPAVSSEGADSNQCSAVYRASRSSSKMKVDGDRDDIQALKSDVSSMLATVSSMERAVQDSLAKSLKDVQAEAEKKFDEATALKIQRVEASSKTFLAEGLEQLKARLLSLESDARRAADEARLGLLNAAQEASRDARQTAAGEADRRLARALQVLKAERGTDIAVFEQLRTEVQEELGQCARACRIECESAAESVVARLLRESGSQGSDSNSAATTRAMAECAGRVSADTAHLRMQFAEAKEAWDRGQESLRRELLNYVTREEGARGAVAAAATTGDIQFRLCEVNSTLERHREKLDVLSGHVKEVYKKNEQQDAADERLESQLSELRSASTSHVQGFIRALQVLGLIRAEPSTEVSPGGRTPVDHAPWEIQVSELLRWERLGLSLASRVECQWQKQKMASAQTLLAAVDRKADEKDLRNLSNKVQVLAGPAPYHQAASGGGTIPLPPVVDYAAATGPARKPQHLEPIGSKQLMA